MTVEKCKRAIYTWGIYPALSLLRSEQDNENFELCATLKAAIDEVMRGREVNTNVDDESLEETLESYIAERAKPDLIRNNMPFYVREFKEFIYQN